MTFWYFLWHFGTYSHQQPIKPQKSLHARTSPRLHTPCMEKHNGFQSLTKNQALGNEIFFIISTALKNLNNDVFALKLSDVFFLILNVKMTTFICILTFMSRIKFMLIQVEHEKFYYLMDKPPDKSVIKLKMNLQPKQRL